MADPALLDPRRTRLSSAVGAVLGIAVALLLAIMPAGDDHTPRLQSAFGATTPEQCLAIADRIGEARRSLHSARRSDIADGSALLPPGITLPCAPQATALVHVAPARAQAPVTWRSHALARAPPRA